MWFEVRNKTAVADNEIDRLSADIADYMAADVADHMAGYVVVHRRNDSTAHSTPDNYVRKECIGIVLVAVLGSQVAVRVAVWGSEVAVRMFVDTAADTALHLVGYEVAHMAGY